jgi:hypothetical protein
VISSRSSGIRGLDALEVQIFTCFTESGSIGAMRFLASRIRIH